MKPTAWDPSWIRRERESQGMSVDALAKRAQLPNSTIASAERRRQCRLSNVERVLRALGETREGLRSKYGSRD